jgi:hypothetical protein
LNEGHEQHKKVMCRSGNHRCYERIDLSFDGSKLEGKSQVYTYEEEEGGPKTIHLLLVSTSLVGRRLDSPRRSLTSAKGPVSYLPTCND